MRHLITLSSVTEADIQKIGQRAIDLSTVYKSKSSVPLSFIVPNTIFYEFLLQNKLILDIKNVISSFENISISAEEIYSKIKALFEMAIIPEEFREELYEAYEALSPTETHNAQALLEADEPVINLIISPNYTWDSEKLSGILFNIQGFDNFLNGLKSCWLSLYSPDHLKLRENKGIEEFSTGIIVQAFVQPECTVDAYSKSLIGDYDIPMNAYFGLPDITYSIGKDHYSVSKENFGITSEEVKHQDHILLRNIKSGTLLKRSLGSKGLIQKLSDKQILDIARHIDRLSIFSKLHFRIVLFTSSAEKIVFFIDRTSERISDSESKTTDYEKTIPVTKPNATKEFPDLNEASVTLIPTQTKEETLADMINAPIAEQDISDIASNKDSTQKDQNLNKKQNQNAFAWESTIISKENPEAKKTIPIKAIILDSQNQEKLQENTPIDTAPKTERPKELSQQIIILNENDEFILSSKEESNEQTDKLQNDNAEQVKTKNQPNTEMNTIQANPSASGPDNEFFMSIILDIEPALDQEIMNRYQSNFGKVPLDVNTALEELSSTGNFPQNEQIFKLKSMKSILEKGETINLDIFLEVTEELRKLI